MAHKTIAEFEHEGIVGRVIAEPLDGSEDTHVRLVLWIDKPESIGLDKEAYSRVIRRPGPRKSKWVVTIPFHGGRASFEEHFEPLIIEAIRGYAFPEAWGYYDKPTPTFRVDFEVEATERPTWEYIEEIRSALISWTQHGYELKEVG
jgi:hypothetical protein